MGVQDEKICIWFIGNIVECRRIEWAAGTGKDSVKQDKAYDISRAEGYSEGKGKPEESEVVKQ